MSGRGGSRAALLLAQLALASAILTAWEWGAAAGMLNPFFFSRPSAVILRIGHWVRAGTIWSHLSATVVEALLSFVIGVCLGVLFGFLLAGIPLLSSLLDPYIRIVNALPRIALAPIFGLWFGLGIWSKVALGATVVFFVVFYNTYRGVCEVDSVIVDNVRMLGASKRQLIQHVIVPSALTWIFSSLHISIGMAIVATVVGEYLGASRGIGYLIAQADGVFDTTGVFAGMTILAAGVLAVSAMVTRLERVLLRWKPDRVESRSEGFAEVK